MLRPTQRFVSRIPRLSLNPRSPRARHFSSALNIPGVDDGFKPQAPTKLTAEMAEGIVDATQFYIRHGISHQRLVALAEVEDIPALTRWQKMMEIYLTAQAHVVAGLGYTPDEQGLTQYANSLRECIEQTDLTMQKLFEEVRRDTWREVVGTTFQIDPKEIPVLTIVEARDAMHKLSSKMVDPEILLKLQQKTAKIPSGDEQTTLQEKHKLLQEVLFHDVYLAGDPSIVEQIGFGPGAQGYAKLQCALTDHEGDPLLAEYASSAMLRMLKAAGINLQAS